MFINKDLKINNHKKFVMVLLGSDSIVFFLSRSCYIIGSYFSASYFGSTRFTNLSQD